MRNKKNSRTKKPRAIILIAGVVVLLVAGGLATTELTGKTHFFRAAKATPGIIPSTSAPSPDSSVSDEKSSTVATQEGEHQPESPKQGDAATAPLTDGAPPLTPSGNFVSQHHPNLDGNPAPSSVESVCNTTPGASCHIEFTNDDGVTKTLAAQTTDSNGAAYWNWDVKSAGFTVGAWKIRVIAELNGQTVTAHDPQNFEVKP